MRKKLLTDPARLGIAKAMALKEYISRRPELFFLYTRPDIAKHFFFKEIFAFHPIQNKFVQRFSDEETDKMVDKHLDESRKTQKTFVCVECKNEIHNDFYIYRYTGKTCLDCNPLRLPS